MRMAKHAGTHRAGFLSERERKYIDSETVPPRTRYGVEPCTGDPGFSDDEKNDLKYRIKENKLRHETLEREIRHLRHDLERARNFWVGIKYESEQWERLYNSIESELEWLERLLDSLAPEPDEDSLAAELAEILVPDAADLAEVAQDGMSEPSFGPIDVDEAEENFGQYDVRKDALLALLNDTGLVEILEHIRQNPGSETGDPLPDRTKTGADSSWRWWAAKYLDNEHEVVKDVSAFSSRSSYVLTEHGVRVCEAIDWLKNREEVKQRAKKEDKPKLEAAHELLIE